MTITSGCERQELGDRPEHLKPASTPVPVSVPVSE
jgi:hypothetical protein